MLTSLGGRPRAVLPASADLALAAPRQLTDRRPKVAVLAACALGFLAVAVLEAGFVSSLAKVGWVTLTIATAVMDPGAGVALYLAGAAVYSPRHFSGWGTFDERPDNFAIVGLVVAFGFSLLAARGRLQVGRVPLLAGMLVFYALSASAALGQLDRATFAWLMRTLGLPLLLFVVLAIRRRQPSGLAAPFGILLALGAYIAFVSVLESVEAYSLIRPPWIADASINRYVGSGRSGGTLLQPEFNGLGLTLMGLLSIGFGWTGGGGRRAVGWAASGLMIAGIFVCYSRGPWLGALLAAGILVLAGGKAGRRRRVIARLGILLALVVLLLAIPSPFARERARDTGTVAYRFNLWVAALRMAAARPILGYGFAQFESAVGSFHESTGQVSYQPLGGKGNIAHNAFLSVLVELGGVGLLLYCATIWGVLREGLRGTQLVLGSRGTALVVGLSVAYFFNGLFVNLHEPFTNCLYFGSMGLLAGASGGRAGV